MLEMFDLHFMVLAFVASVMMGLLLAYLGIHVVGRGIVFVDLALGQISSMGVAFAVFVRGDKVVIPIVFTLIGAVLLSLIRIKDKRLKQEAIIGIIYAVASAATVLLISKTPHGEADISEVLFGHILAVSPEDLRITGLVFGFIALVHGIFFKQIWRITEAYENGVHEGGFSFHLWNFVFYLSIGLTIVFAVKIAGVLPVFSYLIIPPVAAIMMARKNAVVVALSLVNAVVVSYFGLYFSFRLDFPAGGSIVATFGLLFLLASLGKLISAKGAERPAVGSRGLQA